jgi:hypothetical protein
MAPASSRLFSVGRPDRRQHSGWGRVRDSLLRPILPATQQSPAGPAAQRRNQAEEIHRTPAGASAHSGHQPVSQDDLGCGSAPRRTTIQASAVATLAGIPTIAPGPPQAIVSNRSTDGAILKPWNGSGGGGDSRWLHTPNRPRQADSSPGAGSLICRNCRQIRRARLSALLNLRWKVCALRGSPCADGDGVAERGEVVDPTGPPRVKLSL